MIFVQVNSCAMMRYILRGECAGRVSHSCIHLSVNILRVCGGDVCVDSEGLEDELDRNLCWKMAGVAEIVPGW